MDWFWIHYVSAVLPLHLPVRFCSSRHHTRFPYLFCSSRSAARFAWEDLAVLPSAPFHTILRLHAHRRARTASCLPLRSAFLPPRRLPLLPRGRYYPCITVQVGGLLYHLLHRVHVTTTPVSFRLGRFTGCCTFWWTPPPLLHARKVMPGLVYVTQLCRHATTINTPGTDL